MIDWLGEFEKKFESNKTIATLKEFGFHGQLEVNFCGGSPNTVHINWVVKPYKESAVSSTSKGGE